jgi:hypothetical protein
MIDSTLGTIQTCRGCKADIVWALTAANRRIPLDPIPTATGILEHWSRNGEGTPIVRTAVDGCAGKRYETHFSSCEKASAFRNRGPKSVPS